MRLLVAEDNAEMGEALERGLREEGYFVDCVNDGSKALMQASKEPYDLVVLDWMLPGRDGTQVVRELRSRRIDTPVLFLTARTSVEDRVEGLDAGADDYLVKPFSFPELLARIRALLRRSSESTEPVLQICDLRIDLATKTVERAGQRIELADSLFNLLSLLARNAGKPVSRKMILADLWAGEVDGLTNVVDVYINRLRNKIDRGFDKQLIYTLRGVGFVLRPE